MGEYISREAVLAQKGDCYDKDGHLLYAVGTGNILRIPAADVVEVRHGKWLPQGYWDSLEICSECKHIKGLHDRYNYCPMCGAKMDGEKGDNQ